MRLGELLVAAGLLSPQQVEHALRAQVMWGGRLGTNLVELYALDLDVLARVIGRRLRLPAACASHFEAADADLQRRLPAELAAQYACLPLRRVGADRIAIASIAPLDGRARATIAHELGISYKGLVPAVAPELRVHYQLERVYGIPRPGRFLRARSRGELPAFELAPGDEESGPIPAPAPAAVASDDGVPEALLPDFTPRIALAGQPPPRERRHYLPMLGEAGTPLARIAVRRQTPAAVEPPPAARPAPTLDEATLAIRRAPDRDAIARRVLEAVAQRVPASATVLFVVRGGAAASWAGIARTGEALPELAVPLDEPSGIARVLRDHTLACAPAASALDVLLLDALGAPGGELAVAPICIGTHVPCVIAVATERAAAVDDLAAISEAAAVALARLMRHANR